MNILGMICAFLILTGVACIFCAFFRYKLGEGMAIATSLTILILYIAGKYSNTIWAIAIIVLAAIGGYALYILQYIHGQKTFRDSTVSLYYVLLLFLFVFSMIIVNGDHIQHIDELHQWAAAVKYMLKHNHLPVLADFTDPGQKRGTTVFYYFFQRIGGYNEGMMYATASLFIWIGFLLPFYDSTFSELKEVCCYIILVSLLVISLYQYSFKNLLVDLPLIAWSVGVAGWWMNKKDHRIIGNLVFLISGLAVVFTIKNMISILMVLTILLFIVVYHFMQSNSRHSNKRMALLVCGLAGAGGIFSFTVTNIIIKRAIQRPQTLPASLQSLLTSTGFSEEKVVKTLDEYIKFLWCGNLGGAQSDLRLSFVFAIVLFVALTILYAKASDKKYEGTAIIAYGLLVSFLYALALFCAFVFMFSEIESVRLISIQRYLGIIVAYLIMLVVLLLIKQSQSESGWTLKGALICLIIFLSLGCNEWAVTNNTVFNKEKVVGYEELEKAKLQIDLIQKSIKDNDKVYLVNQDGYPGGGEYALSSASYYLDRQVSSYLIEPWKFTPNGCYIHNSIPEGVYIQNLPDYLKQGEYTYLWIFATDEYLSQMLPNVLDCGEASIADGQLFRVIYSDQGEVEGVELEKLLYTMDSR